MQESFSSREALATIHTAPGSVAQIWPIDANTRARARARKQLALHRASLRAGEAGAHFPWHDGGGWLPGGGECKSGLLHRKSAGKNVRCKKNQKKRISSLTVQKGWGYTADMLTRCFGGAGFASSLK